MEKPLREHWTPDMCYDELNKIIRFKEDLLTIVDAMYDVSSDWKDSADHIEEIFNDMVYNRWMEIYDMHLVSMDYDHIPTFAEMRRARRKEVELKRILASRPVATNPATHGEGL